MALEAPGVSGWDDLNFPALGFNPLPGDPNIALELARDVRILGDRVKEQAAFLRQAAMPELWTGEAADAFAEYLGKLPEELDHMGDAFLNLAGPLNEYNRRFQEWQQKARTLEQQAEEIKSGWHTIPPGEAPEPAVRGPVLRAAEPTASFSSGSGSVVAQGDALSDILRQARDLREQFEQTLTDLARLIRDQTAFAPKSPPHHWWDGALNAVGDATGINQVVHAVTHMHEFMTHLAEQAAKLSDLLQSASAILGVGALVLCWAPGIGEALGTLSVATAGAAATLKTGLYLVGAKDEFGRPLVSRSEMIGSVAMAGVAVVGSGIGAAARAGEAGQIGFRSVEAAKDTAKAVGREFVESFKPSEVTGGLSREMATQKENIALAEKIGAKKFETPAVKAAYQHFKTMPAVGQGLTVSGRLYEVGVPVVSPTFTGKSVDVSAVAGFKEGFRAVQELPEQFHGALQAEMEPLGIHLRTPGGEGTFMTSPDALRPVMGS